MAAVLTSVQSSITTSITDILPVAGTLFALIFGIQLIPKIIKSFLK